MREPMDSVPTVIPVVIPQVIAVRAATAPKMWQMSTTRKALPIRLTAFLVMLMAQKGSMRVGTVAVMITVAMTITVVTTTMKMTMIRQNVYLQLF